MDSVIAVEVIATQNGQHNLGHGTGGRDSVLVSSQLTSTLRGRIASGMLAAVGEIRVRDRHKRVGACASSRGTTQLCSELACASRPQPPAKILEAVDVRIQRWRSDAESGGQA